MSNSLEHYGILGMKWGVRRTPEQLGHGRTIKKRTTLYRVAVNGKKASGATYFTHLPPDRDFYKSVALSSVMSSQKAQSVRDMYETKYKTTKDLKIAGREEIKEAYEQIKSNPEVLEDVISSYAIALAKKRKAKIMAYAAASNMKIDPSQIDAMLESRGRATAKEILKEFGDMTPDHQFMYLSRGLTVSSNTSQAYINEYLKKKGYNGRVDEAGVGGGVAPREGVDPLVIFDSEKVMSYQGAKQITARTYRDSNIRYNQWFKVANSEKNRNKPW